MKSRIFFYTFLVLLILAISVQGKERPYQIIVAQDGTGNYKTVAEAIAAAPALSKKRIVIFIKSGVYKEKLVLPEDKINISFLGQNKDNTILSFDDYSGKGNHNTFTSYSTKILGNNFHAENITFQNSAGPVGQAVALHVEADRCTFLNCRIIGDQDTFYGGPNYTRQFFKNCYLEGTTDFIFGPSVAVFENCTIYSKKNSYITAASTPEGKPYGYVFLNCKLTASPEATKVYLGRPWRNFAKTVFINTEMGAHIRPEGWHNWKKPEAETTTFYAEYNSTGAGGKTGKREGWTHVLTKQEAKKYKVKTILRGNDDWTPLKNI
ncbi:pectinesterase family protein [Adhaeribacter aquaticus]|uniref:pectinesterase family protein n=1 Tax=Adhaeribacter aquaticus TaxID=299567 RepID=UPI000409D90F|nr:pectinesterase family protein [Adhaeribacter aquaticus]